VQALETGGGYARVLCPRVVGRGIPFSSQASIAEKPRPVPARRFRRTWALGL